MDTASLRVFRAVVRGGSVVAAADLVHSVPSNVSARVRKLEDDLGARLFVREARGMRLTPAGTVLLDFAERILALTDAAREAVGEAIGEGGELRLASMETTAAIRLPPVLAEFHRRHPKTTLTLSTGTSEGQLDAVLERRADLAFLAGPVVHERVIGAPVFVEELVLAVPAGVTTVEEANTRAMLVFRSGCAYRARTEAWLRGAGLAPRRVMEFGTLDGLLGCVAAGMGVSLLPRAVVERPRHAGQIEGLPIPNARVETWLIQHRDSVETGAARAFKALVMASRDFVLPGDAG
ncbi:LysR family transcriptional regulator [Pararhodospirillum oryzae]|uniref:Putative transcriptional regulator, LysR family protein n=1 Tax=Pararhodospirillum oryzae TaxID=478448 RepID=A0A512H6T1_9PROT|nr:LysR family transcriptional regulator [Pararhodospirillum oryzae]GEO81169.1 putative transcriptional regulator, LysR family protein [Pararhodospirillum oryzae]